MPRLRHQIVASLPAAGEGNLTVVRAGGLGDTLLALPTLRLLLDEAPGARLTLVGSAWAERLLPLVPFPVRLVRFDSPRMTPLFGPDPGEDPTGAFAGAHAVVIYTAAPDEALTRNARRLCPGTVVEWPVQPQGPGHAAAHYAAAVAEPPPAEHELPPAGLEVPPDAGAWARRWLAARFGSAAPVAVHPGSGGRPKCWPAERFAGLVTRLPAPVLLVEGPADRAVCRRVERLTPRGVRMETASGLSVAEVAALIHRSPLYVGNDSGLTHLAAALGTPTMAVFGPTDPVRWAPRGPRVRVVCPEAPDASAWPTAEEAWRAVETLIG